MGKKFVVLDLSKRLLIVKKRPKIHIDYKNGEIVQIHSKFFFKKKGREFSINCAFFLFFEYKSTYDWKLGTGSENFMNEL